MLSDKIKTNGQKTKYMLDGRVSNRREQGLQKSTSQQHISTKTHPPPLSSSKSSMSLKSREEDQSLTKENNAKSERKKSVPSISEKVDKDILVQERAKSEGPQRTTLTTDKSHQVVANGPLPEISRTSEEPDFEKLQEDFVLKLVVDEEPPRQQHQRHPPGGFEPPSGASVSSTSVPPNLAPPPTMHHPQPSPQQNDKWFYQDPQGQTQGPFTDVEMAEWYKAGYFSNQLKLIALCGGASNPFSLAVLRFAPLKADATGAGVPGGPASPSVVGGKDAVVAAAAAVDLLQLQYLSQMAAYKQAQAPRKLTVIPTPSKGVSYSQAASSKPDTDRLIKDLVPQLIDALKNTFAPKAPTTAHPFTVPSIPTTVKDTFRPRNLSVESRISAASTAESEKRLRESSSESEQSTSQTTASTKKKKGWPKGKLRSETCDKP
nr:unnamed protein product [Callosobruchus chinensis]